MESGKRNNVPSSCTLLAGIVATVAVPEVRSQTAHEDLLNRAEERLHAIYDRGEFRPKKLQAEWLPDRQGYPVLEPATDAKVPVRVRYDLASGERTVLDATQENGSPGSGKLSPDGRSVVFSEQGNLFSVEGLVDRLIELGKRFDYMAYPNRDHGLREGRGTEVQVRMLITRYLVEHLPHGPR